jgi:hypothetical protein
MRRSLAWYRRGAQSGSSAAAAAQLTATAMVRLFAVVPGFPRYRRLRDTGRERGGLELGYRVTVYARTLPPASSSRVIRFFC